MKRILLPLGEQMPSVLETAWHLANLFGGSIECIALRPTFPYIALPEPSAVVTLPPAGWNEIEFCRSVRQTFDVFAAAHSLSQKSGVRFRWHEGSAIEAYELGSLARVHDVTVLSRPSSRGARMTLLEAALFRGGRPIVMAPPVPPTSLGETVLIHWNASTETARAILFAMPILRKAKRVSLVSVKGHLEPGGPSVKQALDELEANGISAGEKTVVDGPSGPGEAILAEAAAIGADLLIKGAYARSRLQQIVFGGATIHIMAAAELPVFFVH